ncbi:MAG TPA: phosphoglycerate dehydrogenase [Fibrobacteria bacterium]|nr:phosphoglycerate dehydrogenase [Fibrobacteria bacterium]
MAYRIATLNKISPEGLNLFGSDYEVADGLSYPDAILVRSAQVDTDAYPATLAIARAGAGVNNITVDKATAAGLCVFNTPGANANAVAELVFTVLGSYARNVFPGIQFARETAAATESDKELDEKVEKGKGKFAGFELAGKTLGVIGLGKIGVIVANLGVQHRMKVVAFDPFPSVENIHQLESSVQILKSMAQVAAACDILSIHVPLADKTRGLVNRDFIDGMKDGAILVNYSRGPVVAESDVVAALESGKLRAYLNDFPSKALVNHPKAICTPHLGASTEESEENCATMAVNQLKGYLELGNVVNSVNFPVCESVPDASAKTRLIVINKDVPNMIAAITKVLGEAGVNIASLVNKSNGKVGYNIVDCQAELSDALVTKISSSPDVIRVRVINF